MLKYKNNAMKILVVGKEFSGQTKYLKSSGHDYIILRDQNIIKPSKDQKHCVPGDFSSKQTIIDSLKKLQFTPDAIIMPTYENYIVPAAYIAEYYSLPGIPVAAAQACTDKYLMRSLFAKAPEKISPDFMEVKSEEDVKKFADQHSFPIILKPANLVKSLLVTKSNDMDELLKNYNRTIRNIDKTYKKYAPGRTPKIIIEEFLEGSVHSTDAFVDADGVPHILPQIVDYQTGYEVGYDDNFHYSRILPSKLSAEDQRKFIHCAELGCRALGMKSSPAHIEIIMTAEGPRIVEIGARNGGYRERMYKMANGINVNENTLLLALGKQPTIVPKKDEPVAVLELFPKTPGIFRGLSNWDKLQELPSLKYCSVKAKNQSFIGKSSDGYKMAAVIILHHSSHEQFARDLDFVNQNVKVETEKPVEGLDEYCQIINSTYANVTVSLDPTNHSQAKSEFLNDAQLLSPNYTYDNLDIDKVEKNITEIKRCLSKLAQDKRLGLHAEMLRSSLEYNLHSNLFIKANYDFNHAKNIDQKQAAAKTHAVENQALYGRVDSDTFWGLLTEQLKQIPQITSLSSAKQKAYHELMEMLPKRPAGLGKTRLYVPSDKLIMQFRSCIKKYFRPYLRYIPKGQSVFTTVEAADIVNNILMGEFADQTSWKAVVEKNRTLVSVSTSDKIIKFPAKRSAGDFTRKSLKRIILHELGAHSMRAISLEHSPYQYLNFGLPDYVLFEEGMAIAIEQALSKKYSKSGQIHYINVGLASLYGKNFREVFEIQKRLQLLINGLNEEGCFNSVQRAFRGTGELVNNKDMAYYNGSVEAWKYIKKNIDSPYFLDNIFNSGKTNLFDKRQEQALRTLEIIH